MPPNARLFDHANPANRAEAASLRAGPWRRLHLRTTSKILGIVVVIAVAAACDSGSGEGEPDAGPGPGTCGDAFVPSAEGSEYFVANSGNDENPGTLGAPFQHVSKGLSVVQPGDTLSIREGLYRLMEEPSYDIAIPNGTATAFATLRAYEDERVQIYGSLSTADSSWEPYDANLWRTPADFLQNDPKAMFNGERRIAHQSDLDGGRDHDNVENLVEPDHWTKADVHGAQCFNSNDGCYIYLYPAEGELPNNEVYELSQRGLGRFWSDYMAVIGLEVYYTQSAPIFFEGANNIRIEGNIFGHNSNGNDNAYGMRIWSSGGALVRGNTVFDSVYWGGVSNSKGITFMVSDPANPHIVEYNEIYDIPGQAAVGTKGGVSNLIVRYNYIHDVHTAFEPGGYRCEWSATNTDGCQVTDVEYRPGGGWQIYGNIVVNAETGVRLPGFAEDGNNNRVQNNVFYGCHSAIGLGWDGTFGNVFANNIFMNNAAGIYLSSGGTTTTVDDYLDQYESFNNLYFENTLADIHLRPNWGGTYESGTPFTVLEFQSQFDSEANSLSDDPLFVDAPDDFHLQSGSPARAAGDGEYFGEPAVDIGAYPLGEWPCHN